MGVQTFWLERTDQVAVGLRRYTHGAGGFDCEYGHHQALVYTGIEAANYETSDHHQVLRLRDKVDRDDPRWPHTCAQLCGYEFTDDDQWQAWQEQVYRRTDTSELRVLHQGAPAPEAPSAEPGACWDAWWMPSATRSADGMYLMVRCPDGHDWSVDKPGEQLHDARRRHPPLLDPPRRPPRVPRDRRQERPHLRRRRRVDPDPGVARLPPRRAARHVRRARCILRAAVWASVGWNCRGLLDYLADRLGDTPPAHPTRRHP